LDKIGVYRVIDFGVEKVFDNMKDMMEYIDDQITIYTDGVLNVRFSMSPFDI
jgi:predicted transcriptional regulator